jgi:hypothetical protein
MCVKQTPDDHVGLFGLLHAKLTEYCLSNNALQEEIAFLRKFPILDDSFPSSTREKVVKARITLATLLAYKLNY